MGRLVVWFVGWALRRNLSIEERNKIVIHLTKALQAVPLSAIISENTHGEVTVSGSTLDMETARMLLGHARAALDNKALHLIREQVTYEAFVGSAIKAQNSADMLFYRAALWWGQREEYFLKLLAQSEEPDL